MSRQQSHTRGKQSTAQKRDSSRGGFGPIPATGKVDGASRGNQPVGRTNAEVNDYYIEEKMKVQAEELRNEDTEAANEENVFNPVIESLSETTEK